MGITYKQSGVDIDAGDAFVDRIGPLARRTLRPEVLSGVGGFGGLFALAPGKYKEPVLVSGTDGVGTKLKLAFSARKHDTIGIDLVAMSVNDVITSGAEPLFFLDYLATSRLDVDSATRVVEGIVQGCEQAGCTLLGGETAEMPGFYTSGEYDLAGFCVGIVERSQIIDGKRISPGDAVIGLASSGLHSNGFSLARKILEDARLVLSDRPVGLPATLSEMLLEPTRIYVKDILALKDIVEIKGIAHITGSGIPGNLPRCLPQGTCALLDASQWKLAPLFSFLADTGQVDREEMYSTFNMGLGMTLVVAEREVGRTLEFFKQRSLPAWRVGQIEKALEGAPPTVRVR